MARLTVIGIDPGMTGAIAVWDGKTLVIHRMPVVKLKVGKTNKNSVSPTMFSELLRQIVGELRFDGSDDENIHVFIEKAHSMPRTGSSAAFSFGTGYGVLLGAIAMAGLSFTLVTFQSWHKKMVGNVKGKDAQRERAANLFPKYRAEFMHKKDDGPADAALIAKYGRRELRGNRRIDE